MQHVLYGSSFKGKPPARTLIQPATPTNRLTSGNGQWQTLEEISIIAFK